MDVVSTQTMSATAVKARVWLKLQEMPYSPATIECQGDMDRVSSKQKILWKAVKILMLAWGLQAMNYMHYAAASFKTQGRPEIESKEVSSKSILLQLALKLKDKMIAYGR